MRRFAHYFTKGYTEFSAQEYVWNQCSYGVDGAVTIVVILIMLCLLSLVTGWTLARIFHDLLLAAIDVFVIHLVTGWAAVADSK